MKHRSPAALLIGLLLIAGIAVADEMKLNLDLPTGNLTTSVDALAKQAGLNMLFDRQLLEGKTALAVKGNYTPREALEKLLAGSGLEYSFTADNAVAIKAASSEIVTEMSPIEVRGTKDEKNYVVPVTSTGSKIEVPNRDIPYSVEARPIELMQDMGGPPTVAEMLKTVAGVTLAAGGYNGSANSPRWITRGYYNSYLQRDGFSAIANYNAVIGMANVEQIEVLQGPSAVLSGTSTSSGMSGQLNIVTKKPSAEKSYGGSVAVGSWNFRNVQAYANGAVNKAKTVLVRLDVADETQDSWKKYSHHSTRTIAPAFKFLVSDKDTINLRGERTNGRYSGGQEYLPYLTTLYSQVPRDSYFGTKDGYRESVTTNALLEYIHKFDNGWKFTGSYSYINNEMIFNTDSITWNQTTNTGAIKMSNGQIHQRDRAWDIRADGHVATGSVDNYLLAGITQRLTDQYANAVLSTNTVLTETLLGPNNPESAVAPIFPAMPPITGQTPYDYKAVYVQDMISFAGKYKLMVGGRYDDIDRGKNLNPPQVWTHYSKRFGLVYQPTDVTAFYGGYSESFAPTTTKDFFGNQFTPETGYQHEVGVKQTYNDRLNANLALYRLIRDDILTTDPDPTHLNKCGLTGTSACSIQGGTQEVRGIELNVNGQFGSWRTNFAYSHLFSQVTTRSTTATLPVGGLVNAAAPKNTANLFGIYSFGDALAGLEAGGGIYYRDASAPLMVGTTPFELPYVLQLDAEVGYKFNKKTKLQFNVKNLANRANDYVYSTVYYGTPRSYYLNLKVDM